MSDLTDRARASDGFLVVKEPTGSYIKADTELIRELADRIDELEQQVADYKTYPQTWDESHLEEWIDTIINPKSESGYCFFCQHPIGRSVFAFQTFDPAYHEDDCPWMKRQSPRVNKWREA